MIIRVPRDFLFPLTTLAFIAIPVEYVGIVFTTTTRWIFLVALTLYLLTKWRLLAGFRSPFGVTLLVYCAWCISTYSWSEVSQLSFEKAGAFSLIAVTLVSAGQGWCHDRGRQQVLYFLVPVTAIALFAGLGGGIASEVVTQQRGAIELYEGLTDNPNMLGSLIAMALPLLLWSAYHYRATPLKKWLWIGLLALALGLLARTYSRSAILSAGMLGIGFCLSLKLHRTGFVMVLIAAALLCAAAVSTAVLDTSYDEYVLKGGSEQGGVMYSRTQVWQKSYENAEQGGWFGAGYGVTVGDKYFEGGATAVGYGREKGNSQLAIVEETGIVGLALYSLLLLTLFTRLISAHLRERSPDTKVALGIITGALAGLTAMSVFEAWWVAPGSAESAYFWSLAGVGLGLAQSPVYASRAWSRGHFAPGEIFHSARYLPQRRVKG